MEKEIKKISDEELKEVINLPGVAKVITIIHKKARLKKQIEEIETLLAYFD